MFDVACNNEQQIPVNSSPSTDTGRPAQVDGALIISVQSGDGTFSQDPATPLVFKAVSGPSAGQTVYLVEADADLGAGVRRISDTVTLTVTSAEAASFGFSAGVPEPKP
mgnify:CR=1 FL=1